MPGAIDIPTDIAVGLLSVVRGPLTGEGLKGAVHDIGSTPRRVWQDLKGTGTYAFGKPAIRLRPSDIGNIRIGVVPAAKAIVHGAIDTVGDVVHLAKRVVGKVINEEE